jgi:hypothetical protein
MINIDKTMNPNDTEILDSTTETETTENQEVVDVEVEEATETPTDDVEALKKEIATLKVQKAKWREKATQAPQANVTDKPVPKAKSEPSLSPRDVFALTKANIDMEDIDDVIEYASFKKVDVSEALKSPLVQSLLREKDEMRKTALATHTGAGKKGTTKVSNESLLNKVAKGEIPENDEDIAKLFRLRKGLDK